MTTEEREVFNRVLKKRIMEKSINEIAKEIYQNAKDKGFHDDHPKNIGEMLMLIVSEVSEALEADRKAQFTDINMNVVNGWVGNEDFKLSFKDNVKDTFEDELADVMIRVMDLASYKDIDLEAHIKAKMRYNSLREQKHGKRY